MKLSALLTISALVGSISTSAAAQTSAQRDLTLLVVDGVKLPYVPGLLDSLSSKRYTIDSTTTPHRARVKTGTYTPSGVITVPLMSNVVRMLIVKPARAIALYGEAGTNGAIVISTQSDSVDVPRVRGARR